MLTHALPSGGDVIRTVNGPYLVEQWVSAEQDPAGRGYVIARRAERPMTHTQHIHLEQILELIDPSKLGHH